jgi:hypothetical protein
MVRNLLLMRRWPALQYKKMDKFLTLIQSENGDVGHQGVLSFPYTSISDQCP